MYPTVDCLYTSHMVLGCWVYMTLSKHLFEQPLPETEQRKTDRTAGANTAEYPTQAEQTELPTLQATLNPVSQSHARFVNVCAFISVPQYCVDTGWIGR